MLIFKKISWCNLLSTGNVPNVIHLNQYSDNLISGKNGQGKSTILDALCFSLFGRTFRSISKNQLVNSINKKNCLVEIEFEVNNHNYIVKRGIKPNIFEIYCDGEMINQDAAVKDYQSVLEQQILKLNFKTFTQVVILGSATFVPFMQLPSAQRREVIEGILDIKVFSLMNTILKEKAVEVEDQINKIETDIAKQKVQIQAQKKLIDTLESNRQNVIASIQSKIDANNDQINKATQSISQLNEEIAVLKPKADSDQITDAVAKGDRVKLKLSTDVSNHQRTIDFFQKNTTCPTCTQHIDDEYKQTILDDVNAKIKHQQIKLQQVTDVLDKMNEKLEAANKVADQIRTLSIDISTHTNTINLLSQQSAQLMQEMNDAVLTTSDLTAEKSKMKHFAEDAIELVTKKGILLEERQLHDVAAALLKDTGIKTAIIKEYLPVMNKLINKYLSTMDFFVKFELDELFQEIIKSRGRDTFTYDSFSEGEKQKINLAIMFTWRQIAKMKNSVNTNLLIMDEILDSSLDVQGVDTMMQLVSELTNANVFIISHREAANNHNFSNVINVKKVGDFSVVTS